MAKKKEWNKKFLFEGRGWYDIVNSEERFLELLSVHNNNLEEILTTKRLPAEEEGRFIGKLPRFSIRQNSNPLCTQPLGEWFKENKISLGFVKSQKKKK